VAPSRDSSGRTPILLRVSRNVRVRQLETGAGVALRAGHVDHSKGRRLAPHRGLGRPGGVPRRIVVQHLVPSAGGRAGSGEEQSQGDRADVLRSHLGRSSGPNACSDQGKQRLDQGRNRNVAANIPVRTPPLDERDQRPGEAGLGRAPLAQQDNEVLADRDQRPDDARERLVDRDAVDVCLREAPARLLVRRPIEPRRSDSRVGKWR
jgi:hypothetical protein